MSKYRSAHAHAHKIHTHEHTHDMQTLHPFTLSPQVWEATYNGQNVAVKVPHGKKQVRDGECFCVTDMRMEIGMGMVCHGVYVTTMMCCII